MVPMTAPVMTPVLVLARRPKDLACEHYRRSEAKAQIDTYYIIVIEEGVKVGKNEHSSGNGSKKAGTYLVVDVGELLDVGDGAVDEGTFSAKPMARLSTGIAFN